MNKSIHKSVYEIFLDNPNNLFRTDDVVRSLSERSILTKKNIVTMVLTRLYQKNIVLRTPTQLKEGYIYSLANRSKLDLIYNKHLLPYQFDRPMEILAGLTKINFENLRNDSSPTIDNSLDFVKKYNLPSFREWKTHQFLAMLVGFSMCDGNLSKQLTRTSFFFRLKNDGEQFISDFTKCFPEEELIIKKANTGDSYIVEMRKGSHFTKLIYSVGSPKGNKVFQPFSVPDWIYHGPDEIKKIFLSTVIGNEGSAPSNGRWRIQFVLSKCKEYVPNLIEFLNQIRAMLCHFGITTSHIQLRKQKGRQFHGRFYIKGKENLHKFYKSFSFLYASEKQEVLEELISKDKFPGVQCAMTDVNTK